MSNERQRRRRRRRQRRQVGYEPAGAIEFPGFMGYLQRNQRAFYLGGIVVMVLSLGGIIFATECTAGTPGVPLDAPTVEPEPTVAAEATPAPGDDAIVRSYGSPPALTIDTGASYEAVIRTERGDIRLELYADEAPGYVNNFVFLARNRFYEGLTFHRVVPGFVAQGGDPAGSGFGNPGYALEEERNSLPFDAGVISMAKAGPSVNGSQFFITLAPTPHLADDFTAFGRVIGGMEVLAALSPRDPSSASEPGDVILGIEIIER